MSTSTPLAIPSIGKEITKKKQCRACDNCRKCKKKCDGASPCERCKGDNKICTYSLQKRRVLSSNQQKTSKNASKQLKLLPHSSAIADLSISRRYLELYFYIVNPSRMVMNFDISLYDQPKSKSVLLQYNAVLATAIRAFGGSDREYRGFETRAKQLASELLEEVTFDTAYGFYMLAFHLWGEDDDLGCHYRDITLSICKRLSRQKAIAETSQNPSVIKLELATAIIGILGESNHNTLEQTIAKVKPEEILFLQDVLLLAKFQADLWKNLLKEPNDKDYFINPFKKVDKNVHTGLCIQIQQFENVLNKTYVLNDQSILVVSVVNIFKSMLYYTSDKSESSLACIKIAVDILEGNTRLIPCCNPFMVTVCHLIFLIAFSEKDYLLANRISGFQRKLADIIPSSRELMERDMGLLKSVGPTESPKITSQPKTQLTFPTFLPPAPLLTSFDTPNIYPFPPNPFETNISVMTQPAGIQSNSSMIFPSIDNQPPHETNSIPGSFLEDSPEFEAFLSNVLDV